MEQGIFFEPGHRILVSARGVVEHLADYLFRINDDQCPEDMLCLILEVRRKARKGKAPN